MGQAIASYSNEGSHRKVSPGAHALHVGPFFSRSREEHAEYEDVVCSMPHAREEPALRVGRLDTITQISAYFCSLTILSIGSVAFYGLRVGWR